MRPILISLIMFLHYASFSCSCIEITNPCDWFDEYRTLLILKVDKVVGTQIAHVSIMSDKNENPLLKDSYIIEADSMTSCQISIGHLKEGDVYYFGFPVNQLDQDVIQYSDCMSPFYDVSTFRELAHCSVLPTVKNIDIHPNPIRRGSLFFPNHLSDITDIFIYDANGSLISEYGQLGNSQDIELPELAKGLYFLKAQSGNARISYSSKFLVQ